jgi:hypothetical protein
VREWQEVDVSDQASEQPERIEQTVSRAGHPDAPARLRKQDRDPGKTQHVRADRRPSKGEKEQGKRGADGEPSGGGGAKWD